MNTLIAAISGSGLVNLLIWVVVVAVIFWLVNWFIVYIGIGEPFNKVIKVIMGLACLIFLINAVMGLVGKPFFSF